MNTQEAIEVLEQHQLWRKGLPPYEHGGDGQPHTPAQLGEAITHAIEYMKRGPWRPIAKIPLTASGPNWDFSDRVLFRIFYKETGIVTFDVGRVMIDNVLNRCELPDNKCLEYDRITHFYDLSNLPEPPQERKA